MSHQRRSRADGYEASHRAVAELKAEGVLSASVEGQTSKYLNNLVEQDHRRVKRAVLPDAGFQAADERSHHDRRY